jgi:spore maturation protein CgeB
MNAVTFQSDPAAREPMRIVIIGLTITSSWGNGHATTYRGLVRGLAARGHDVLFLEHDKPWYASHRDLPRPLHGRTELYSSVADLTQRFAADVRDADVVIVGSYVPEGIAVGAWMTRVARGMTAFYDIDTPVTLAKLRRGECDYLSPSLIAKYRLYLSFTGGPVLRLLETEYRSPRALPLYCSVDPEVYRPVRTAGFEWDLGYLGTYSDDRQPALDRLMLEPARRMAGARMVVAGARYPNHIQWPENVQRIQHLPPAEHRAFYCRQRFTLNVTRADMVAAGYSPSVRLFEAAACGTPIISDWWEGLDTFFVPGEEILISRGPEETIEHLSRMSERDRAEMGRRARAKVLSAHTAAHRAAELEGYVVDAIESRRKSNARIRTA